VRHLVNGSRTSVAGLPLPASIQQYVADVLDDGPPPRPGRSQSHCPPPRRRRVNVALKFWPPSDVSYWPRSGWVDDCLTTS